MARLIQTRNTFIPEMISWVVPTVAQSMWLSWPQPRRSLWCTTKGTLYQQFCLLKICYRWFWKMQINLNYISQSVQSVNMSIFANLFTFVAAIRVPVHLLLYLSNLRPSISDIYSTILSLVIPFPCLQFSSTRSFNESFRSYSRVSVSSISHSNEY